MVSCSAGQTLSCSFHLQTYVLFNSSTQQLKRPFFAPYQRAYKVSLVIQKERPHCNISSNMLFAWRKWLSYTRERTKKAIKSPPQNHPIRAHRRLLRVANTCISIRDDTNTHMSASSHHPSARHVLRTAHKADAPPLPSDADHLLRTHDDQ